MARTEKENMVRNAAQAALHLQTAQDDLSRIWQVCKDDPRPFKDVLSAMMLTTQSILETLGALSEEMWELTLVDLESRR